MHTHYNYVLSQIIEERGGLSSSEQSDLQYFGVSALKLTPEQEDRLAAAWYEDEYPAIAERERLDAMFAAGVFD